MAANPKRIKLAAMEDAPQSRDDVNALISTIGWAQRERAKIEAEMNQALADVRERFEAKAKPYAEAIAQHSRGIAAFCEAHRDELTKEGKTKTVRFASGEVSWRLRPPSVAIRGIDVVIDAFRRLGLTKFLREKVEVDKEAILRDPDAVRTIKGITISQREDFVVKPDETALEEVAP